MAPESEHKPPTHQVLKKLNIWSRELGVLLRDLEGLNTWMQLASHLPLSGVWKSDSGVIL